MADHVVDTNVLIVASAAEELQPQFTGVPVDPDEAKRVFDWLIAFRDDASRCMVLDEFFKIYEEYHNKLSGQHFGLQVIDQKMRECLRTVPVDYDGAGFGVVPATLAPIDNSDKKFVAAALNDTVGIHIVNACDSDWTQHSALLKAHGVVVVEILE